MLKAERSNPNRRAEISRVHSELNRGYKTGGRVGAGFKKLTNQLKQEERKENVLLLQNQDVQEELKL